MDFRPYKPNESSSIESLFRSVFTTSEGSSEGTLIGGLSKELMAVTARRDLYGFVAVDNEQIVGAIFFSRLTFEEDVDVFMLSPVAIHSDHQGMGIGMALINHGLQEMKRIGVRTVTTYGDPAFYSKVGFNPLSQDVICAPLRLSQPDGWLGQSLTDGPVKSIPGRPSCVKAFDNPAYW